MQVGVCAESCPSWITTGKAEIPTCLEKTNKGRVLLGQNKTYCQKEWFSDILQPKACSVRCRPVVKFHCMYVLSCYFEFSSTNSP